MATVAESTINVASDVITPAAKDCAETRLAARMLVVRVAPNTVRKGLVSATPLSKGLFDQEATDRVFALLPTIIKINQQAFARLVMWSCLFL